MIRSPFRWVGSKAKLLDTLMPLVPQHKTYFEPFLGSGVMALNLNTSPKSRRDMFLGDSCYDLIVTWRMIRDEPLCLIERLSELKQGEEYYYEMRDARPAWRFGQAVRFYYLNQTCFNGLYRVNKSGDFNVPWGKREFKLRPDLINEASRRLKGCLLHYETYGSVIKHAGKGDFVYLDPPYVPADKEFVGYSTEGLPNTKDLLEWCHKLTDKGAMFMLSNSDTPTVREAWKGYKIVEVETTRSVSSDPAKRGKAKELVIMNY